MRIEIVIREPETDKRVYTLEADHKRSVYEDGFLKRIEEFEITVTSFTYGGDAEDSYNYMFRTEFEGLTMLGAFVTKLGSGTHYEVHQLLE